MREIPVGISIACLCRALVPAVLQVSEPTEKGPRMRYDPKRTCAILDRNRVRLDDTQCILRVSKKNFVREVQRTQHKPRQF